jgi:hypothetical protein
MTRHIIALASVIAGFCTAATAQNTTVLVSGLNSPMKLAMTPGGNLVVSEATVQLNTGRVSIVSRAGERRSLLEGLPSGPAYPGNAPLGPAALVLDGRTLYVGIQEGDALIAGPTPGSHPLPNPNGPASPIFSSVLRAVFSADLDRIITGFNLSLDDHYTLADGGQLMLTNVDGQTATVDLVADFPDVPLDKREVYGHVTPYGMALDARKEFLYVADAGQNRITRINLNTGRWQTVVRFPRLRLPGDTLTDPVPTSVRVYGDELLVAFLSGNPFVPDVAMVETVNPTTGEVRPFIVGLRTATDIIFRDRPSARAQFFVTELRSFLIGQMGTGRLIQYDTAGGKVIADQLAGPTGMVQDPVTGEIFVAEFGGNRISQIKPQ